MSEDELIQPDNEVTPVGLYEKLLAVMRDVENVANFGRLKKENIIDNLRGSLISRGLVMFPARVKHYPIYETIGLVKNTVNFKTVVEVTYKVVDCETGSFEFVMVVGEGSIDEAMDNAFRIALGQTFFVDDTNKA